ncbi:hypothetical protein JCGZ_20277 [Jatropha curcas]|uniref:Legume lectin domain-containing protein n=1 Tax=Jatropha curcas TaxID=180498 RepID=A0A067K516_JATCU|nr:hypothetical protein JCGZ_20277 [Jatropha curcas]
MGFGTVVALLSAILAVTGKDGLQGDLRITSGAFSLYKFRLPAPSRESAMIDSKEEAINVIFNLRAPPLCKLKPDMDSRRNPGDLVAFSDKIDFSAAVHSDGPVTGRRRSNKNPRDRIFHFLW